MKLDEKLNNEALRQKELNEIKRKIKDHKNETARRKRNVKKQNIEI